MRYILLAAILALSGCSVGPQYVKPNVAVNQSWSEQDTTRVSQQAPPDTAWWRAFNDATLDTLVRLAYHENLPLQVAGLRIMESRAQLGLASGRQWPQIQAVIGSATGVGVSKYAANGAVADRNYWDYQLGFDVLWELDFWGKYRGDVKAQTASYLATVADYDNALVSLVAEVARTYTVYRTYEVLIDDARENVRVQQDGLRIAESRYRNGATSELDVTQAGTLLASTQATIPALEGALQVTKNALCTLLGRNTGSLDSLLVGTRTIPNAPSNVAVSVPAELLRRRPDIRGGELTAAAQCARIGVAVADLYPSFTLVGSIGTQTTSGAGRLSNSASLSNLFGAGSLFYGFGPRIFWPLFNYGRIKNNIRIQDARFQQALVSYRYTVIKAAQEVEDGLTGFLRAQEAVALQETAAQKAQRSVDLSIIQYREGAVDYQRVLDAQRSLLQEQNTLAQAQSSVATNWISLYKALGGGWELRQGQPVVPDSTRIEMQRRTNWGDYFSEPPPSPNSTGSSSDHR